MKMVVSQEKISPCFFYYQEIIILVTDDNGQCCKAIMSGSRCPEKKNYSHITQTNSRWSNCHIFYERKIRLPLPRYIKHQFYRKKENQDKQALLHRNALRRTSNMRVGTILHIIVFPATHFHDLCLRDPSNLSSERPCILTNQ